MFALPDGFALPLRDAIWSEFRTTSIWPDSLLKPNGLASVLALLVFVVEDMKSAMSGLAIALQQSFVQLPTPIAKNHRVFLRNRLVIHSGRLAEYQSRHWFDPGELLEECQREWSKDTR